MPKQIEIKINHEVLVWARESLALTRQQAAEKTNLTPKRLLQLEEGTQAPKIEELKALSKGYKRTIATLLLNAPPKEKPLPKDRRTIDSHELGNFHEKSIMAVRKARAMARAYVELWHELGLEIPKVKEFASLKDEPSTVAQKIRRLLQLDEVKEITNPNLALEAYIEKVESCGISVFQISLTQDRLRGFSIVDDVVPIIGIKRGGEQPYSKNFTLFHELGHILLNDGGLCDLSDKTTIGIEKWCNALSAEILVPQKDLLESSLVQAYQRQRQKIWAKQDLITLGNKFHVGPLSILRRLLDNGLTTREFYQEKHAAWNKPSFGRAKNPEGRNIAKETLKEKGRTYVSMAFRAFDQNRIDLKDLSDYLGIRVSYIPKTRQLLNT
jgi:Zn-dependent peptidase ImmA (M78 family)/DNA-binding XRE family transcriptional regulator